MCNLYTISWKLGDNFPFFSFASVVGFTSSRTHKSTRRIAHTPALTVCFSIFPFITISIVKFAGILFCVSSPPPGSRFAIYFHHSFSPFRLHFTKFRTPNLCRITKSHMQCAFIFSPSFISAVDSFILCHRASLLIHKTYRCRYIYVYVASVVGDAAHKVQTHESRWVMGLTPSPWYSLATSLFTQLYLY